MWALAYQAQYRGKRVAPGCMSVVSCMSCVHRQEKGEPNGRENKPRAPYACARSEVWHNTLLTISHSWGPTTSPYMVLAWSRNPPMLLISRTCQGPTMDPRAHTQGSHVPTKTQRQATHTQHGLRQLNPGPTTHATRQVQPVVEKATQAESEGWGVGQDKLTSWFPRRSTTLCGDMILRANRYATASREFLPRST